MRQKRMIKDEPELDLEENIIIQNIRHYFHMKMSRHYMYGQEGAEAAKLIGQIQSAIEAGIIPKTMILALEVPPPLYVRNRPISRTVVESWFMKVANHLMDKAKKPDDVRYREYEELMNGV